MSIDKVSYDILTVLKERGGSLSFDNLKETLNLDESSLTRNILSLEKKGYVKTFEEKKTFYSLTDEGRSCVSEGLLERKIYEVVASLGGILPVENITKHLDMPEKLIDAALGWLVKKGWGKILREDKTVRVDPSIKPVEGLDEKLLKRIFEEREIEDKNLSSEEFKVVLELKKRGLVREKTASLRYVQLTNEGLNYVEEVKKAEFKPKPEISILTSEIITSGKWREVEFKKYDVTAQPPTIYPGKKHFFLEFIRQLKNILVSLGFEEADGPYVELEFWNFDVLFQPQDHPAREIHDSYQVKNPMYGVLKNENLVKKVKKTHENGWITGSTGWRYEWSFDVARKLVMRSQTTAVSARFLFERKKVPVKMFCVSRVFRPDVLDAKHAMEFYHCEGIVADENLNFKHLLGMLKKIVNALGIEKVKFKPGYFPFTEPSVEVFVYHQKIGWMECAGAGLFRPEVTLPLGVKCPVLAWGIGVDRLAMVRLGVDDIRELHTRRLDYLRAR
ncbi:MAG: phenylalanine--tRNA ligase subunit alpha [Candidatus Bathyarchaeota archaeon]